MSSSPIAPLELTVLGAFGMKSGGQTRASAATDKDRSLLTFLALEGTQPRTTLTALLWPYLPQAAAFDHLCKKPYRLHRKFDKGISGAAVLLIADHQRARFDRARIVVYSGPLCQDFAGEFKRIEHKDRQWASMVFSLLV